MSKKKRTSLETILTEKGYIDPKALDAITGAFSDQGPLRLAWGIDRLGVVITTEPAARSMRDLRFYRVLDLVGEQNGPGLPTQEEKIMAIMDHLKETIDADGWADNGGNTGTIRFFSGRLCIQNTARNHARIEDELESLRRQIVTR